MKYPKIVVAVFLAIFMFGIANAEEKTSMTIKGPIKVLEIEVDGKVVHTWQANEEPVVVELAEVEVGKLQSVIDQLEKMLPVDGAETQTSETLSTAPCDETSTGSNCSVDGLVVLSKPTDQNTVVATIDLPPEADTANNPVVEEGSNLQAVNIVVEADITVPPTPTGTVEEDPKKTVAIEVVEKNQTEKPKVDQAGASPAVKQEAKIETPPTDKSGAVIKNGLQGIVDTPVKFLAWVVVGVVILIVALLLSRLYYSRRSVPSGGADSLIPILTVIKNEAHEAAKIAKETLEKVNNLDDGFDPHVEFKKVNDQIESTKDELKNSIADCEQRVHAHIEASKDVLENLGRQLVGEDPKEWSNSCFIDGRYLSFRFFRNDKDLVMCLPDDLKDKTGRVVKTYFKKDADARRSARDFLKKNTNMIDGLLAKDHLREK